MRRCLELARKGAGHVAPNPMVGAVLVHDGALIGEGYHQQYGQPHAEVNCIRQAIENGHADRLSQATLYVTLEPCAHFGKTPPCADLIIAHGIPRVVVGCRDPFKEVNGKGIERMQAAGIHVVTGMLEEECRKLNRRFFCFHTLQRPFIILKWAQSRDGRIAGVDENKRKWKISHAYSDRLVHQWRATEPAILVGTNTALYDDPLLTTRLWPGPSPTRLVLDMQLRLPGHLHLFDGSVPTIVFNSARSGEGKNLSYYRLSGTESPIRQMMDALHSMNIQSVLVEGGSRLLQTFIDEDCWDEARIITNKELIIGDGLSAPQFKHAFKTGKVDLFQDCIEYYTPLN